MFTQHSPFGPAADKFGPIGGNAAMDEASARNLREEDTIGFVDSGVAPIYCDDMAFGKIRNGRFYIAGCVLQDGPAGEEKVINLRFICPVDAGLRAIAKLLVAAGMRHVAALMLPNVLFPVGQWARTRERLDA
jgi:hypothetical protein